MAEFVRKHRKKDQDHQRAPEEKWHNTAIVPHAPLKEREEEHQCKCGMDIDVDPEDATDANSPDHPGASKL